MDRVQVYRGQLPYETDVLEMQQFAFEALGLFAMDLIGSNTVAAGLLCAPTSPASLNVKVGPGRVYTVASLDTSPLGQYSGTGGLPADTNPDHQILKQGLVRDTQTFAITPPVTSGQSQVYLIQAQLQEVDDAATTTQFYNTVDPTSPIAHNVSPARRDKCVLNVKPGVAATTGTQVTPTPDAGWTPLWAVTVANGQSSIGAGNITLYPTAPFLTGIASTLNPIFAGLVTIGGALDLSGVISPSQITAQQNDYNPTGYSGCTILRLNSDASRAISGMAAPSGEGGVKILRNIGTNDIVLQNMNGSSVAANRFNFGADRTLSAGRSIMLVYDAISGCWRDLMPIRKATTAEVLAGVNDEAFLTALALKNAMVAQALTDASTIAWDMNLGFRAKVTLGGNRALGQPTNLQEGATGSLQVVQDGTGSRTLSYAGCWDFGFSGAPALSTGAGKRDIIYYEVIDAVTPILRATFSKAA